MSKRARIAIAVCATLVFGVAAFLGPVSLVTKAIWAMLWAASIWFVTRQFRQWPDH